MRIQALAAGQIDYPAPPVFPALRGPFCTSHRPTYLVKTARSVFANCQEHIFPQLLVGNAVSETVTSGSQKLSLPVLFRFLDLIHSDRPTAEKALEQALLFLEMRCD
jgi:hypothetical protein